MPDNDRQRRPLPHNAAVEIVRGVLSDEISLYLIVNSAIAAWRSKNRLVHIRPTWMAAFFTPNLKILPQGQSELWPLLAAVPARFTLYGGTASA